MINFGKPFWAITQDADGKFSVIEHTSDGSVMPITTYETKRLAVSRLLQIMGLGPVAPQLDPECVSIDLKEPTPPGTRQPS